MTIDEAFRFVNFIGNKEQGIGFVTPSNFNIAAQRAQMEAVKKHLKVWEDTQETTDILMPLLEKAVLNVATTGNANYPVDYMRLSSMRKLWYAGEVVADPLEVPVEQIENGKWAERISSQLRTPSYRFPVFTMYNTHLEFRPKNIGSARMDYFKYPAAPVWNYTNVNNRPQYDPLTSVQFTLPDEAHDEICFYICSFLGIDISFPTLIQYAEQMKTQTN